MPIVSGVPQGSVLGPILFILYINDLSNIFQGDFKGKLFADDLKAYSIQDYRLDSTSVQLALNAIGIWLKVWQLQLAAPKCGSLLLNINRNFQDGESLVLNGQQFLKFNTVMDLRITLTTSFHFFYIFQVLYQKLRNEYI